MPSDSCFIVRSPKSTTKLEFKGSVYLLGLEEEVEDEDKIRILSRVLEEVQSPVILLIRTIKKRKK